MGAPHRRSRARSGDAGRRLCRGARRGAQALLGDGGRQELRHSGARDRRVHLRAQSVQPSRHRSKGLRHRRAQRLEEPDESAGDRPGPLQREPARAPLSGQHLLRLRAIGRPRILGGAALHPRRQPPLGDPRGDHAALPQRPYRERHRRNLRGRAAIPDGEPAARARRRLTGLLARAGRRSALAVHLRIGATLTTSVTNEGLANDVKRQEGSADYSMTYGLPGKPGYRYTRPFDYFHFEFTAVPNASTVANAIENVATRGLLIGAKYEWGDDYRGVWGLFGGYDYLSPQIFRVSTTALSLGTAAQWWLSRAVALQGTALAGIGFGAAGTVADKAERDYHYGVIPQVLLGLRLIFGDRAMLEAAAREYFVAGAGAGGGVSASDFGAETIARGNVGFTVRLYGPHAIGLQYLVSIRDTRFSSGRDRHQSVETVSLSYNFLGHTQFGAVEWRPAEAAGR